MDISNAIIDFIQDNRVSTTELADALGKRGVIPNVFPVNDGTHVVGKIRCVFAANSSNYSVHEQVRDVEKGDIVVVFTHNCEGRAILGDLIAKYVLLYRGASALVVDGMVRDVAALKREKFRVWSNGSTPIGCFNTPADSFPPGLEAEIRSKFDGAIAVCDDGGVVVIEKNVIGDEILERLHRIEMQEDIWFFCLDTLKWDTKKIVCDKAYLAETELLSSVHLKKLGELNKPLDVKR